MIRTDGSVFIYNGSFRGSELRRAGREVQYLVNGKKVRTYTIAETE
jgi:hypothetical protein